MRRGLARVKFNLGGGHNGHGEGGFRCFGLRPHLRVVLLVLFCLAVFYCFGISLVEWPGATTGILPDAQTLAPFIEVMRARPLRPFVHTRAIPKERNNFDKLDDEKQFNIKDSRNDEKIGEKSNVNDANSKDEVNIDMNENSWTEEEISRCRRGELNLIVQFAVIPIAKYNQSEGLAKQRQKDYFEAFSRNLLSPYSRTVHVLLQKKDEKEFILAGLQKMGFVVGGYTQSKMERENSVLPSGAWQSKGERDYDKVPTTIPDDLTTNEDAESKWCKRAVVKKLHFHFLGRWLQYRDAFGYANRYFPGKPVMIMNGDISIWKGFHLLSYATANEPSTSKHLVAQTYLDKIREPDYEKKRMQFLEKMFSSRTQVFALSRWEDSTPACPRKVSKPCNVPASIGSYDVFIFLAPIHHRLLAQVNLQQNIWGAENRVVWTLYCLNISVTNPCSTLRTMHHHCITTFRPMHNEDPPGIPQVKYDGVGQWAYPAGEVADSLETRAISNPPPKFCFAFPWNKDKPLIL